MTSSSLRPLARRAAGSQKREKNCKGIIRPRIPPVGVERVENGIFHKVGRVCPRWVRGFLKLCFSMSRRTKKEKYFSSPSCSSSLPRDTMGLKKIARWGYFTLESMPFYHFAARKATKIKVLTIPFWYLEQLWALFFFFGGLRETFRVPLLPFVHVGERSCHRSLRSFEVFIHRWSFVRVLT